jgi:hypothetical protein
VHGIVPQQPPPGTAAQHAVARTAVRLLVPSRETLPFWFGNAIDAVTGLVATFWRERQSAPSRSELSALLTRLLADIAAIDNVNNRSLAAFVFRDLVPAPRELLMAKRRAIDLSSGGQGDALDRIGWPSPKLLTACGVIALCRQVGIPPPGPKNQRAIACCAAFLWRARELAGDPAPAADTRATLWFGSLTNARRVYGSAALISVEDVNPLNYAAYIAARSNTPLLTARQLIDEAIEHAQRQTHRG